MSIQRCVFFIVTIYVSVSHVSSEQGGLLHLDANWNSVGSLTQLQPSAEGDILAKNEFLEPTPPPSPPPPLNEFRESGLPSPSLSRVSDEIIRPVLSNLKPEVISNGASNKIGVFDHIHRTVKHLTKNLEVSSPLSVSSNVQSEEVFHIHRRSVEQVTEDVEKEEFLPIEMPIEHKPPSKLPSMEEFDLTPPETSGTDSEDGSGDDEVDGTPFLLGSDVKKDGSNITLIPGPGLLHVPRVLDSLNHTNAQAEEQYRLVNSEASDNQYEAVDVDHLFELAGPPPVENESSWLNSDWSSEKTTKQDSSVTVDDSSKTTRDPSPVKNEDGWWDSQWASEEPTKQESSVPVEERILMTTCPSSVKYEVGWWDSQWSSEEPTKQESSVPVEERLLMTTFPSSVKYEGGWGDSQWSSEEPTNQESPVHVEDDAEDSTKESKITSILTEEAGDESDEIILIASFTTMNPSTVDEVPALVPIDESPELQEVPSISQSSHINHNSTNSNSTGSRFRGPLVYILRSDGPLAQFVSKHAAVLVGIVMAIPAMIILLYFIHRRRRRGYTGSLYVSPTSVHTLKKKSRSDVTFCSYENETSMAPSTSSTPPKPPPLPKK